MEKNPLVIKVRRDKTFTHMLTPSEIEAILLKWFRAVYDEETKSMSLEIIANPDKTYTISGRQTIDEG